MNKIRKAVIPAAGFGTRFLPETKAMPKEMLPIVDKPTIQYSILWKNSCIVEFRRFSLFPDMQRGLLKIILILLRSWSSIWWRLGN